ncbi:uncharacterized protein [Coffea arabica]|uniref:Uncharacterized protein isoform X3 n=1 Tax=Coffea arabica TaxID=13443 RepID=A0ABM4WR23_COFAR
MLKIVLFFHFSFFNFHSHCLSLSLPLCPLGIRSRRLRIMSSYSWLYIIFHRLLPALDDRKKYSRIALEKIRGLPQVKLEPVMMSETFVIDNNEVSVHLNDRIPAEIAENFKEFFPEDGDLSLEEVLLQQESAFQYIQANGKNKDKTSNNGQTSNRSQPIVQEGECSSGATDQLQSATDEALARALQEYFYINEPNGTVAESREPTPSETPVRVTNHSLRQDDIDPDNMTYEGKPLVTRAKGFQKFSLLDYPHSNTKRGCSPRNGKKKLPRLPRGGPRRLIGPRPLKEEK